MEHGRDAGWAQPVALSGVPNLHRVNDGLYRSGQPDKEGMRNLATLGIRTIINLRAYHSDTDEVGEEEIDCVRIPMHAWRPREDDVAAFLAVATSPERAPILVHCNYGADRTGFMCALYRIVIDGWSKERALTEMVEGGFGFHGVWRGLVEFIEDADVDMLRWRTELMRQSGGGDHQRTGAVSLSVPRTFDVLCIPYSQVGRNES